MTVTLDISGDWEVVDNTSTVTFHRRLTEATFATGATVENALGRSISKEEMEARGLLARAGKAWHLWQDKMPSGVIPKTHDVIEDADTVRWTILKVEIASWESRYACYTIQERS